MKVDPKRENFQLVKPTHNVKCDINGELDCSPDSRKIFTITNVITIFVAFQKFMRVAGTSGQFFLKASKLAKKLMNISFSTISTFIAIGDVSGTLE